MSAAREISPTIKYRLGGIPLCYDRVWVCCWPVCGPLLALFSLLLVLVFRLTIYGTTPFAPSVVWWVYYWASLSVIAFQDVSLVAAQLYGTITFVGTCTYFYVMSHMGYNMFIDVSMFLVGVQTVLLVCSIAGSVQYVRALRSSSGESVSSSRVRRILQTCCVPLPLIVTNDHLDLLEHAEL